MITSSLLLFLDFGGGEIIIILLVILVVLGPDKIPAFAKKAAEVMRYIRKATDEIKVEINKETDALQQPFKSAYESANTFTENAEKAVKDTIDQLEIDEEAQTDKIPLGKKRLETENNEDLNNKTEL